MAVYNNSKTVTKTEHPAKFEKIWKIGEKPEYPGIYECKSCLYEDVINRECEKFPPCSNCKNGTSNKWQLLVQAQNAPE
ncbi:TPA: hypothetical protein PXJ35_004444 [Yersinia enterocolitica]|nr:hypothetical protein [Yersinia enterocolitica]HDL6658097.1 hypothetical protein [Yersinia enterocolitica]HDL6684210.1 hypothetical protein [Yersinia enterocolitica]